MIKFVIQTIKIEIKKMSLGYRVLRTTIIRFLGMVVFAVYWNFNGLCTKMIEKNNTCKTQKM